MKNLILTTIILVAVGISATAEAKCRKSWVCDDYGQNCKTQQICDSKLDLPSTNVTPIKPLPSTKVKPLPSTKVPPIGTKKCEYKQVNGLWKNVCK